MSTPREHYLEAERLLRSVNQAMRDAHAQGGSEATIAEIGRQLTATAHVHALLALATGEPTEPVYSIALEPDGPLRHVRLSQDDTDGGWVTECLDVPGAMGQGETPDEAIKNLGDSVSACLAAAQPPSAGPWAGRGATNTPADDSQATEAGETP